MHIVYQPENVKIGRVTEILSRRDADREYKHIVDMGDDALMIYPDNIPGMTSVLKVDLTKKTLFYDYYAPETLETKIQALEKENADLKAQLTEAQSATLELHEGQTQQDAKIQEANNATLELYELIAKGGTV
ncbi:hypothetical protein [Paenibacillus faecalis]|uniref:hypothetical protein n=1 Tax=Paenibacillus faecalis TaxID=2079532 RepID=UPI000D10C72F|nr:hypothetical protein [Paenibacillus faecalis]